MKSLFEDVRSEVNLFSAWRHVRRSSLTSKNPKIRGVAGEFEHSHQRHLKRIAEQLREDRFIFDDAEGVLKDKKKREADGKDPRPIAIATLESRVVQRAILQILQPRVALDERDIYTRHKTLEDPRLGKLNLVNRSKYGVGGLMSPYGGVRPAIELILEAMSDGGKYYYQSDIKAFFTKIPTKGVVDTVLEETGDEQLAGLFARALEVNLANKDELLSYAALFPSNGIGVAQGSSLSALAGNVLLYDFDHGLNELGVTAVRYIDDLVIVSPTEAILETAVEYSKRNLDELNFSLYQPVKGSDKASQGKCEDAFRFLGCTLQPNRVVPSSGSISRLKRDIAETISASKREIKSFVARDSQFDRKLSQSAVLHSLGSKIYGWEKSFSFCTDAQAFRSLDSDILSMISDYENWVRSKTKALANSERMQVLGIPSTEVMFNSDNK